MRTISLRLSEELLMMIDTNRGAIPRERFLRDLIDTYLAGQPPQIPVVIEAGPLAEPIPRDPTKDAPIPAGGLHRHKAIAVGEVYYRAGVPTTARMCSICGIEMDEGHP